MRYIKEILKKNRIWVLVYIGLGIFNAFMANYKADYFQKVIDGLADRTLAFAGVATYGFILLVNYCMNIWIIILKEIGTWYLSGF